MVAGSADSRAERSDRWNRGAERPLPSHTWKGPLPCDPLFPRARGSIARDTPTGISAAPPRRKPSMPRQTSSRMGRHGLSARRDPAGISPSDDDDHTDVADGDQRRHRPQDHGPVGHRVDVAYLITTRSRPTGSPPSVPVARPIAFTGFAWRRSWSVIRLSASSRCTSR
jgi:hypothetical protein